MAPNPTPRVVIKLRLTPEQRAWLRAEAALRGSTVTEVLREMIRAEMARRRGQS